MTAPAHKTLAEALVAAQAEMPAVEKDAVNPHFRSRFTSLDHLIAKTRPVLTRHGLAVTQWPTHLQGQPALRTKVTHVSGESDEDVMPLLLAKNDMQGLGGAVTYAKRYMWAAVCAVSTDEDDDGNTAAAPPAAARQNGSNGKAPRERVEEIETLIAALNLAGPLTEVQIRDGMLKQYGTEVTAELTAAQAAELVKRLAAKASA